MILKFHDLFFDDGEIDFGIEENEKEQEKTPFSPSSSSSSAPSSDLRKDSPLVSSSPLVIEEKISISGLFLLFFYYFNN